MATWMPAPLVGCRPLAGASIARHTDDTGVRAG